jgi:hypothetical protein
MATKDPPKLIDTFDRWTREVRARLRDDYDQIILITGDERTGKSTLAFQLAHALDPNFTLRQCVFQAQDLIDVANSLKPGEVVWLDEAIKGGMNRDAMSKPNRQLVRYFTVAGERNLCYLILWPNKDWLDPHLREHRAHWWIHVQERGQARLFWPDKRGAFQNRPYWVDVLNKPFPFNAVDGYGWRLYLAHKKRFVNETGRQYATASESDDAEPSGQDKIQAIKDDRGPWVRHLLQPLHDWRPKPDNGEFTEAQRDRLVGWNLN